MPTLAIAYSNKAWGILTDIMGDDSTVIDGKSFATEFRLDMVRDFWNRRGAIRQHLDAVMPAYIKRAHAAEEKLTEVVGRI